MKLGILLVVVGTGLVALSGNLQEGVPRPGNFDSWERIWAGSTTGGSALCTCLYNVRLYFFRQFSPTTYRFLQIISCFNGFSNANYALSEVHNPTRTLRIAGPLSIIVIAAFYLLCNIAYYAAGSKEEITSSGRLVASLLFKNVWGPKVEKSLNGFIALSALGNVLSVVCLFPWLLSQQCLIIFKSFSQGRVNQALGKEGILPFSSFWASSWPAKAPLAGLGLRKSITFLLQQLTDIPQIGRCVSSSFPRFHLAMPSTLLSIWYYNHDPFSFLHINFLSFFGLRTCTHSQ